MNVEQIKQHPNGPELIRRLNFNMLLLDCIDNNSSEIISLMKDLNLFKFKAKHDIKRFKQQFERIVNGIDEALNPNNLNESFGELSDYLFTVMNEAEKVSDKRDEVLIAIKGLQ